MGIQYGIYLPIILGSIISTVIFFFVSKSKDWVRNILFFSFAYYFVFAIIKSLLGNPELSLIQSFWEADIYTYIHYSIPLGIIAVLSPLLLYGIIRNKVDSLISWNVSLSIVVYPVVMLLVGNMPNAIYVVLFALILLISFILSLKQVTLSFMNSGDIKNVFKDYWAIAFFPVFLVLFYFPNELYLTNIREFYNPYVEFIFVLLGATLIFTGALLLALSLLPRSWVKKIVAVIFGISICSYLQYLFFNGPLDVMLGKHQEWNPVKFISNGVLWLAILIVLIVVSTKNSKALSVMKWASLFVVAILFVTVSTLLVQNLSSLNRRDGALTHDGDIVLAPSDNVLVFVLDNYDFRIFMEIMGNDSSFADPLHDFVLYDDAISRHSYTDFSIPYMLTGSAWHEDEGNIFQEYAYDGDTMLSRIYSTGADIGVYTDMIHFNESKGNMVRNYRDDIIRETDIESTLSIMAKTSLYKMMPFAIKENYFYDTSDMSWMVKYGELWSDYNDVPFYERIVNDRLSVDNNLSGTFRFYHMRGEHYPFYLSEDVKYDRTRTKATAVSQAKGSMKIVYTYMEQLKELGLYDDATIIITADHGDVIGYNDVNKELSSVSRPILFVKKSGQHGDELQYNHAEVSHVELIPTILDAYGLDYSSFGARLEDIDEDEIRERYFGYYTTSEGVVKGHVIGEGGDINNWIVE